MLCAISLFAAANDVTARWWQKHGSGGQFSWGKSFDTFCPVGDPVPAQAVADPQDLLLRTRVNGTTVQEASTGDMIFTVAHLLSELSRGTTLLAGSMLLTGTPGGVGSRRDPPTWLTDGDVVEIEIESIGTLRNTVRSG